MADPISPSARTRRAPLLSEEQMDRYSRHVRLDEVGVEGQRKLLDAKVVIIGAGGLGSPAALYLAAAGVGTIGVVDGDVVDLSNLQRQILHFHHDRGRPKTQSARRHLEDINPDVKVVEHREFLTSANAMDILRGYDVVVNGSDNFATRYLVNDACVLLRKPLVDASILRFEGQATVYLPGRGCYRCLFPNPPPPGSVPSCGEAGVIGALAGHMGTLQAVEAIKVILGVGEPLANRLLLYDALEASYRTVHWKRRTDCPVCGDRPTITRLIDYEAFCGLPPREQRGAIPPRRLRAHAVPEPPVSRAEAEAWGADADGSGLDLSPERVAELIERGEIDLVDVRERAEFDRRRIAGSRLIPADQVAERLGEIDRDRTTVFVCRIGEMSGHVARELREEGFDRAYNLRGGLAAWVNYGLPLEQGPRR